MEFELLKEDEYDIYYQILLDHFPKNEIKGYNFQKKLLQQDILKILTMKQDNQIIGILAYYQSADFYFVDYFAIVNKYQRQGLGHQMLTYFKEYVDKPIVLEVERPEEDFQKRRIAFYQDNDFKLNLYDYQVNVPKIGILYFYLMTYPNAIEENAYQKISQTIIKDIYYL